ncbi:MAG: diguanylate cyclase domain-containing protein [Acidimicrobiales bacterium]
MNPNRGSSVTLRAARAVAARRRSATELRRNERVYRQIVDMANEGIWAVDADARTTFVNPKMAAMLGYAAGEMLGLSLYDFMDDQGRFVVAAHLARRRDGVAERGVEFQFRRRDGSVLWATLSTSPLVDEVDGYVGALALVTDVTDRRQQARRLTEANERFQKSFDASPIGMALTGLDGRLLEVNPALCKMLDYSVADLLQRRLADLSPEEDAAALVDRLATVTSGDVASGDAESVVEIEARMFQRGAGVVWVLLSVAAVNGPDGRPAHLICHCQDITERRLAREHLVHQALHDTLTGLPNRLSLNDRLEHALSRRRRRDGSVAVLFVDVDSFKAVNDTHGHDAGDRLLVEVADRLRSVVRPQDTVARLGGDEFVILLAGVEDHEAAVLVADRARAAVAVPFLHRGRRIRPSVSIGISVADGRGATPQELVAEADGAMYTDKQRRRARPRSRV